jgi:hypothetical protein
MDNNMTPEKMMEKQLEKQRLIREEFEKIQQTEKDKRAEKDIRKPSEVTEKV